MKINPSKSIRVINRLDSKPGTRKKYYTMERNERVDEFLTRHIKEATSQISSYDFRTYPNNNKIYNQLSKYLKINRNNILLTEGAEGGLLRFFNVFANPGDKVVYLDPSFGMYELYCEMFKLKKHPLKLQLDKKFSFFERLVDHLRKTKPKILAMPNPNQPIETMINSKQLKYLCKLTNNMNIFLVLDEAYYYFNNISAQKLYKKFNNLLIIRSFSKAFGLAGLRIGYCVSNKRVIDSMKSIKPIYEINSVTIKLLSYFLKNLKIMTKNVSEVNKSRIYIKNYLKKLNIEVFGNYSNNVLIKLKNNNDAKNLEKKLYKNKFIVQRIEFNGKSNFLRCTMGSLKISKEFCRCVENITKN